MSAFTFKPATKKKAKLRLALIGPSGSGKTLSALKIASGLGTRIAVIDTERGSASLYSDQVPFDSLELETFAPTTYVQAIKAAEAAGFDVIVIDSLSHAWMGKDGALEQVDNASRRSKTANSFTSWRDVTPQHNAMVDAIIQCKAHVIVTMRTKTEYVLEDVGGKKVPKRVGMAPIQRDGLEYEFTVVGELDGEHFLSISKTRCPALAGKSIHNPGTDLAAELLKWLDKGVDAAPVEAKPQPAPVDPKLDGWVADMLLAFEQAPDPKGYADLRADLERRKPELSRESFQKLAQASLAAKARLGVQP